MLSALHRSVRGLTTLVAFSAIGLTSAPLSAQQPLDTDPALVARFAFDDALGTAVASDLTGHGLDAVLQGGATFDASTRAGVGASLRTGAVGSMALPPHFDVNGSGLTVTSWFRADSFPGPSRDPRIVSKANGLAADDHVFMLGTVGSGKTVRLQAHVRVAGHTTTLTASSGDLSVGVWNHAAVTHDGKYLRLFLNGVPVGRCLLPGTVDVDPRAATAIGNQPPGAGDKAFDGLLDDVRIYERALSKPEVRALAASNFDIDRVVRSGSPLGILLAAMSPPDTTPPTAPPTLKARAMSSTSVELAWAPSTDNVGVELYEILRDGAKVGRAAGNYFDDDTALPSTTYTYEVVALDAEKNVSPPSPAIQVTTPAPPIDPAEIAAYGFEEGLGTLIEDSTGNGNVGTLAGATRATGFFGAGISTDGASGSVDLGGIDVSGSGLTLAMWCRPAGFGVPDGRLISKASGFDADAHLWMLSRVNGNQLRFRLRTDAGPTQTLIAPAGSLALDQWSHVAATYDGSFMRIYQDGMELASLPWTGAVLVDPNVNAAIGDQPGGGKNFHGELDEVWIFGRALSPIELVDLMANPITDPAPDMSPPTAPDQFVAYGVSTTRIDLHWTAGEDDDQVSQYRVLRDGVEVGITSALTYRDTGLVAGTSYAYSIRAEDPAGNLSPPTAVQNQSTLSDDQDEWFDVSWNYRFPIVVDAVGHARTDLPVDFDVDFTAFATAVGASGALDTGSIRVIEVNAAGQVLDAAVPFQFDPAATFDASTNAIGKLVFVCDGWLPATARRHYHVYFDLGTARTLPAFTNQVSVIDSVIDEGQASYEITTGLGTYYYQKDAGGFSSLHDLDGNDWIDFHPTGGAAGNFRGIPNLSFPEGHFHPGATSATSTLVRQGPLAIGIHSITMDGWECTWDVYRDHARLTVLATSHPYWFLYEGTPGGVLEPGVDLLVRASGAVVNTGTDDRGDIIGDEWSYFVDPNVGRGLFFANHNDDPHHDTYFPLQGVMTVFGFGRENIASLMTQIPATFTIGFLEDPDFAPASAQVRQFFHDLDLGLGPSVVVGGVAIVPTAASNVMAVAQSTSEVQLSWTAATDNVGIDGYRILRDGVEVAFVNGTSFLDSGLQSATTYAYEIVAVDLQGMMSGPTLPVPSTTL